MMSGFYPMVRGWKLDPRAKRGMPAYVTHGAYDPIIPVGFGRKARDLLEEGGLMVTYREARVQHSIDSALIPRSATGSSSVITGRAGHRGPALGALVRRAGSAERRSRAPIHPVALDHALGRVALRRDRVAAQHRCRRAGLRRRRCGRCRGTRRHRCPRSAIACRTSAHRLVAVGGVRRQEGGGSAARTAHRGGSFRGGSPGSSSSRARVVTARPAAHAEGSVAAGGR